MISIQHIDFVQSFSLATPLTQEEISAVKSIFEKMGNKILAKFWQKKRNN